MIMETAADRKEDTQIRAEKNNSRCFWQKT